MEEFFEVIMLSQLPADDVCLTPMLFCTVIIFRLKLSSFKLCQNAVDLCCTYVGISVQIILLHILLVAITEIHITKRVKAIDIYDKFIARYRQQCQA